MTYIFRFYSELLDAGEVGRFNKWQDQRYRVISGNKRSESSAMLISVMLVWQTGNVLNPEQIEIVTHPQEYCIKKVSKDALRGRMSSPEPQSLVYMGQLRALSWNEIRKQEKTCKLRSSSLCMPTS